MGRRSINTTKSGKYMNPTDQARKEARKRELKKNKKQRQMVRAAVLKGKDPSQIILEMEKMDQMEYNVEIQPTLSEKVLKDKRKKLRETLDRVLKLYEKENPEYWSEIRRMESDYEKKRLGIIEYYDSVRHAQAVTVDEIPLPNLDMPSLPDTDEQGIVEKMDIILAPTVPNSHLLPSHSILKKAPVFIPPPVTEPKKPPGCPPTVAPELSDDEDEWTGEGEAELTVPGVDNEESKEAIRTSLVRFAEGEKITEDDEEDKDTRLTIKKSTKGLTNLQTKLLQMSGQDIDEFMKETEVMFREKEAERKARVVTGDDDKDKEGDDDDDDTDDTDDDDDDDDDDDTDDDDDDEEEMKIIAKLKQARGPPLPGAPSVSSNPVVVKTPEVRPTVAAAAAPSHLSTIIPAVVPAPAVVAAPIGLPLGVPPVGGILPLVAPLGVPPLIIRPPPRPVMPPPPGIRLPPGLPPQGLPPRLPNMRMPPPMPLRPPMRPPGMLPGLPHPGMPLRHPPPGHNPNVLSAAPQLIARPREEEKQNSATIEAKPQIRNLSADVTRFLPTALRVKREDRKKSKLLTDLKEFGGGKVEDTDRKPTKDDAYSQFMKEMEGLL